MRITIMEMMKASQSKNQRKTMKRSSKEAPETGTADSLAISSSKRAKPIPHLTGKSSS